VPSLASHAAHHYWQCALLQHSIAIVLYACHQQSSFTVHDKQATEWFVERAANEKEWRRRGKFYQSFLHFTDINTAKSGGINSVKCKKDW
jgi:hypothetical protein